MSKLLTFAALSLTALLVGCQNMDMGKSDGKTPDKAIVSVTPTGSVVLVPTHEGQVKVLSSSGAGVCEQCKKDAAESFATGKPIAPKCPACGATHYPVGP